MGGKRYEEEQPLRSLVRDNPDMLMLIRRFGISLGFGNKTVKEVCYASGVDAQTFLAVANFTSGKDWSGFEVNLEELIKYLKNTHEYFLGFSLPTIRRKLIEALPVSDPKSVSILLLSYFDDYVAEVESHIEFENSRLFPYIMGMLKGKPGVVFGLAEFEARHDSLTPKLMELKEIFITHFQAKSNEELLVSALYDIIGCERELARHCAIEDELLIPVAMELEPVMESGEGTGIEVEERSQSLTTREKEIVRCIARGLSTKEIAGKLFLSAHTVNTHRRNICAKLDIHSAPALTIYAIIHQLVDISEIKTR